MDDIRPKRQEKQKKVRIRPFKKNYDFNVHKTGYLGQN